MNWLTQMKGVGLKTASIVMVFSLDMPAFPVDTHIYRVTGRLDLRPQKMNIDNAHRWFMTSNRPESFGSLHLNIISLGRDFCQARKPKCRTCPVGPSASTAKRILTTEKVSILNCYRPKCLKATMGQPSRCTSRIWPNKFSSDPTKPTVMRAYRAIFLWSPSNKTGTACPKKRWLISPTTCFCKVLISKPTHFLLRRHHQQASVQNIP